MRIAMLADGLLIALTTPTHDEVLGFFECEAPHAQHPYHSKLLVVIFAAFFAL